MLRRLSTLVLLVTGALVASSCGDPTHEDAVDALGPERKGVRQGPSHRPGQPCRTCHGGLGPSSLELSIAGTVYSAQDVAEPLSGVAVRIVDNRGVTRTIVSNEVGNFYIASESWSPAYPFVVELQDSRADADGVKRMESLVNRAGDCATCHYGRSDEPSHVPPVYLRLKAL